MKWTAGRFHQDCNLTLKMKTTKMKIYLFRLVSIFTSLLSDLLDPVNIGKKCVFKKIYKYQNGSHHRYKGYGHRIIWPNYVLRKCRMFLLDDYFRNSCRKWCQSGIGRKKNGWCLQSIAIGSIRIKTSWQSEINSRKSNTHFIMKKTVSVKIYFGVMVTGFYQMAIR